MYEERIQELVDEIQGASYSGTPEEIQMQKIIYLDNYVRNKIDYGIEAVEYDIDNMNNPEKRGANPYKSAYTQEGFWNAHQDGKRRAVCGPISEVVKEVLNRVGIPCDYVYGHVSTFGHRWNVVEIGGKEYFVDLTASMISYKKNNPGYEWAGPVFLKDGDAVPADFVLKSDLKLNNQTLGGFSKNEVGGRVDDLSRATLDIKEYATQEEHPNVKSFDNLSSVDNRELVEIAYKIPEQGENRTITNEQQKKRTLQAPKKNFTAGNINSSELLFMLGLIIATTVFILINIL